MFVLYMYMPLTQRIQKLKSPFVIKMYGSYRDQDGQQVLVLEKVDGRPILRPANIYSDGLPLKMRAFREFLLGLQDIRDAGMHHLSERFLIPFSRILP